MLRGVLVVGARVDGLTGDPPECLVPVTAEDYFAGRDRALETILSGRAVPLADVLEQQRMNAFIAEYERLERQHGPQAGWFPYTVFDLRRMGAGLLTSGRRADAVRLFEFATARYPEMYWTWEMLGNLHAEGGDKAAAVKYLRNALEMNPNDPYVRQSL